MATTAGAGSSPMNAVSASAISPPEIDATTRATAAWPPRLTRPERHQATASRAATAVSASACGAPVTATARPESTKISASEP